MLNTFRYKQHTAIYWVVSLIQPSCFLFFPWLPVLVCPSSISPLADFQSKSKSSFTGVIPILNASYYLWIFLFLFLAVLGCWKNGSVIKEWPCEHEDLRFEPPNPHTNHGAAVLFYDPMQRGQRPIPGARWPASLCKVMSSVTDAAQKTRWRVIKEDT